MKSKFNPGAAFLFLQPRLIFLLIRVRANVEERPFMAA